MEIALLIIGIIVGAAGAFLIAKYKFESNKGIPQEQVDELSKQIAELSKNKEIAEGKVLQLTEQVKEWKDSTGMEQEKNVSLNKQLSTKEEAYKNIQEKLLKQKEEIENIQTKFTTEFKNLANEILEDKSKKFTEQNKTNIDEILKPLNEKIKDFEKRVVDTYDKESKERFSLQNEIKNLVVLNQTISKEANNLTNALKGQAKTQGNWGEMILENILEKSGLVKGREYFVQQSFTDNEGKRLQPDVVVNYPGNKSIVIDSKVSLNAYERYSNEEDKTRQDGELKMHIDAIKLHINTLSSKNYQDLYQLTSLDFVLMFVPIEPAFMLAVQADPDLWSYAYERRILLISPTNLISTLKIVSTLWRQEYQNRNAMEIAKQSGDLYDKFVGLMDDLINVGKRLKSTQESYEESMKKLSSGKGNLIKRAEDIKALGAKAGKALPQTLIDRSIDDETEEPKETNETKTLF
jgi:DNA recombination protein RmuC